MKTVNLIFLLFLLVGCQQDRINISKLSPHDRVLFAVAAAREDVEVTLKSQFWEKDWIAEYNLTMPSHGYSITKGGICYVSMNTQNIGNDPCEIGGANQQFIIISRHELRHCQGISHSEDPNNIMYPFPQCWPVD